MIDIVNNDNDNTISHEKCFPVSICKIITHKITIDTLITKKQPN